MGRTHGRGTGRDRRFAIVTGGSRGVGAATVEILARRGFDVTFTYRSRARHAQRVVRSASTAAAIVEAVQSDMADPGSRAGLFAGVARRVDALVLNASGGLEPDRLADDPDYANTINRYAQLAFLELALPLMAVDSTVVFVTSHWAHLYGRVEQLPMYEPVARSKHAGERALRERLLSGGTGPRLIVVTGDIVEGTVTPKLLERYGRGVIESRRGVGGALPTAEHMATAIVDAIEDPSVPSGFTGVVGGSLQSV